jgi:hypothetical protein
MLNLEIVHYKVNNLFSIKLVYGKKRKFCVKSTWRVIPCPTRLRGSLHE